jgi:hypothetical protein
MVVVTYLVQCNVNDKMLWHLVVKKVLALRQHGLSLHRLVNVIVNVNLFLFEVIYYDQLHLFSINKR